MVGVLLDIMVLIYVARHSRRGLKFILYILCGYWILSYWIRPLLFIYSRNHNIDSSIYDFRIGQNHSNFFSVMFPIFLGCAVFCIPLLIHQFRGRLSRNRISRSDRSKEYSWILLFGMVCGFLGMLMERTNYRNPFSKSVVGLITICFSMYLWKRKDLKFSQALHITMIVAGCSGVLLTSIILGNSKGVLLFPLLIYVSTLTFWNDKDHRLKKLMASGLLFLSAFPIFEILQSRHLGAISQNTQLRFGESLPWYFSPFLSITGRFDQFARIADAHFANPSALGGFGSWIQYVVYYLKWKPSSGRTTLSFGQNWNELVTEQSVPGSRLSNVSLAQGMVAEGLIWNGLASLIVECLLFSVIFIFIGTMLERGPLPVLMAFGLIGNGSLFENGSIGFVSLLSGTAKMLVFIWIAQRIFTNRSNKSKIPI